MNSTEIEKKGINKLSISLDEVSNYITYNINQQDKEPLTDGYISIYKNKSDYSNRSFNTSFKIQVKSTTNIAIYNKRKYSFDRITLQGFKSLGGIVLFVICLLEEQESHIFYQKLTVPVIDECLKSENKNIPIELADFPQNKDEKLAILRTCAFELDPNKEKTLTLFNKDDDDKSIVLPSYIFDMGNKTAKKLLSNTTITAYRKDEGTLRPTFLLSSRNFISGETVTHKKEFKVSNIGEFDLTVTKEQFHDNTSVLKLLTGEEQLIEITCENNHSTLELHFADTLEKHLTNVKIIIALFEAGNVTFKKLPFNMFKNISEQKKIVYYDLLHFLEQVSIIEEKTTISFYKNGFSEEEVSSINNLYNFITSKKQDDYISILFDNKIYSFLKIKETVYNLFDSQISKEIDLRVNNDSVNPYIMYTYYNNPTHLMYNYNFDIIKQWFETAQKNEELELQLNLYLSSLIRSYNETKNKEYLNNAREILDIASDLQMTSKCTFLNKMWIQKTLEMQVNTKDDIEKLLQLSEDDEPLICIMASNLLGKGINYNNLVKKLDGNDLQYLKNYNFPNIS
ncbi:DUF4365 domain-containing protein [Ligilactobacillus equi]|uniref:DUF4365 domain-containing protein n=1 Tax=Ligilactobacillus equi TaxID=137357 RepID=UPI002ED313F7